MHVQGEPSDRSADATDWRVEITAEVTEALCRLQSVCNGKIRDYQDDPRRYRSSVTEGAIYFDETVMRQLLSALRGGVPSPQQVGLSGMGFYGDCDEFVAYASAPGITITNLLTVLDFFGRLIRSYDGCLTYDALMAIEALHARTGTPDLAQLASLLSSRGRDGAGLVADAYLSTRVAGGFARSWPVDEVAPFVDAETARFFAALDASIHDVAPEAPYAALGTLPRMPVHVVERLYRVAFGPANASRAAAQRALSTEPGRRARVIAALTDGDAGVRSRAAEWLAGFGGPADAAPLEAAYRAERIERVKRVQLDALAALGGDPGNYLNRQSLADQVHKGVPRSGAAALEWINWEALPVLRWADGTSVELDTVRWLLGDAVLAKSAQPSVTTRFYWSLFDATSTQNFGDHLLETWSEHDRATHVKGLLAVCATVCRGRAVTITENYLHTHYGNRAAQCKALLAMLAWIEDPEAAALLLAVSTRFRTRGIQREAAVQVQLLAERRGWSASDLADRTVPDAGFGDALDGGLLLDFGPRRFLARLTPDAAVALTTESGERVKALPQPRISDDPELAAASKRRLAIARKQVKTTVKQQTERLFEAMCAEREWNSGDWDRYVRRHPIVGLLAARLVWSAGPIDHPVFFRPLDDGSLTDAADAEVTLTDGEPIRIAHSSAPGGEHLDVDAWRGHFDDYGVTGLLDQFTAPHPVTDESARSITDWRGFLIESFTLRSVSTRLGYQRGEPTDGGAFFSFEKTYPTIGVRSSIRFSGATQPLENGVVALTTVEFHDTTAERVIPIGGVGSVLLALTAADAAVIADSGTGFDAQWKSQVTIV